MCPFFRKFFWILEFIFFKIASKRQKSYPLFLYLGRICVFFCSLSSLYVLLLLLFYNNTVNLPLLYTLYNIIICLFCNLDLLKWCILYRYSYKNAHLFILYYKCD